MNSKIEFLFTERFVATCYAFDELMEKTYDERWAADLARLIDDSRIEDGELRINA
jgi:hypothetical protein